MVATRQLIRMCENLMSIDCDFYRLPLASFSSTALSEAVVGLGLALALPWLTYLALQIFRISMRRAHIRRQHVLRCALYSGDFLITIILISLAASVLEVGRDFVPWIIFCCAAITLFRLTAAYRLYLRLDHPFATALASQLIVLLAVVDIALNI